MTEILSGWVRAIAGAAVFCAMAAALCPKGRARGVLALASGCVMLLALVSPVAQLDLTDFARASARWRESAAAVADGAGEAAGAMERRVIEAECAAYISSRADGLGLAPGGISVEARWSEEGYWYPWSCRIAAAENAALSDAVEAELGIPRERQSWEGEA